MENNRNAPRLSKAVYIKYEIRNFDNLLINSGVATSRDLSATGSKFMITGRATSGYLIKMRLDLSKTKKIIIIGTITRIENIRPGKKIIGVKFESITEKSKLELNAYLNSFAPKN